MTFSYVISVSLFFCSALHVLILKSYYVACNSFSLIHLKVYVQYVEFVFRLVKVKKETSQANLKSFQGRIPLSILKSWQLKMQLTRPGCMLSFLPFILCLLFHSLILYFWLLCVFLVFLSWLNGRKSILVLHMRIASIR